MPNRPSEKRKVVQELLSWAAIIALLSSFCVIGGCSSSQAKAFNTMFAMGDDKQALLHKRIERFNQALYWGDAKLAVSYVVPASRDDVFQKAKKSRKSEHYVELDVQKVDYEEGEESAEVVIDVQFYRTPSYVIQNRTERQKWVFERFTGGWLLEELLIIPGQNQG